MPGQAAVDMGLASVHRGYLLGSSTVMALNQFSTLALRQQNNWDVDVRGLELQHPAHRLLYVIIFLLHPSSLTYRL